MGFLIKNGFSLKHNSYLILETGEVYGGIGFGNKINTIGELVFNTSITGYQEVITDPSYKGQIVIFTYPHIGNVGTCDYDNESSQVWLKAIITRELPTNPNNWRSTKSFEEYLLENNLPGIAGVDTRKLTKRIRDQGNLIGMVVRDQMEQQYALQRILTYKDSDLFKNNVFYPNERSNRICSCKQNNQNTKLHIAVIDFGCKISILNTLIRFNCKISILNSDCLINQIKKLQPDAVILSNGPGNPDSYIQAIDLVKDIIKEQIPTLGICLGHQILAIALGADIEKLPFGHHGINHPVKDLNTNKVSITSQNHNYVISKITLPSTISITHISLFDNSIQGFTHNQHLFVGFQGHPEGGPGPIDIQNSVVGKFLNTVFSK